MANLDRVANIWLSVPTVQVVIVINIVRRLQQGGVPMFALRYEQGSAAPVWSISFGTAAPHPHSIRSVNTLGGPPLTGVGLLVQPGGAPYPACNAQGMVDYQLHVPSARVFSGCPQVPAGVPHNYFIDLFDIQEGILRVL